MYERVDGSELTVGRRPVERDHDTRNGTLAEADANQVARQNVEAFGDEVAERARRPAHAREDGDLRGPCGHRS